MMEATIRIIARATQYGRANEHHEIHAKQNQRNPILVQWVAVFLQEYS